MGIYDREYYREERQGFSLRAPRTVVGILILVNVAFFLANLIFTPNNAITRAMMLSPNDLLRPLLWWHFLTYGFAHDWHTLGHIFGNMLMLFFFGRDIEERYGSKEFLRIYLVAVVFCGIVWALLGKLQAEPAVLFGASGAVATIVILFAMSFPRRTILFFFVIPMPAWVLGVLFVASQTLGLIGSQSGDLDPGMRDPVAYSVHLAGVVFALLYFQLGWNFGRILGGEWSWPKLFNRSKLRIHAPEEEDTEDQPRDLSQEVDRILEKISQHGEGSLTRKERQTLEEASRQYQRRRKQ